MVNPALRSYESNIINEGRRVKGQIIPYFLVSLLALCLFWFTLINLSKIIRERIRQQIASDNAAISCTNLRSRALNFTGAINGFLGMPGFIVPVPGVGLIVGNKSLVWWPEPPHTKIGFYTYSTSMRAAKSAIKSLITLQKSVMPTYGGGTAYLVARDAAILNGADGIIPLDSFSLQLKRNKGEIVYFKTSELYIPPTPVTPEIWVWPIPYPVESEKNALRWLEMKKDTFHKQRMRLIAYKDKKTIEKQGYPFGSSFLKITGLKGIKSISAAASYNVKGPMFPQEGDSGICVAMKEYLKAKNGGWETHLIPVGSGFRH